MASTNLPRTLSLTVTSGVGSVTFPADHAGNCVGFAIKPPSQTATFDYEIFDAADFGQEGGVGCQGYTTIREGFQIHAGGKLDLTNCSQDGAWQLRLWYWED